MRKYLSTVLFFLCVIITQAQELDMLSGNPMWTYFVDFDGIFKVNDDYEGYLEVGGKKYHRLYSTEFLSPDDGSEGFFMLVNPVGVREAAGRIYADYESYTNLTNRLLNFGKLKGEIPFKLTEEGEYLLFDFTLQKGDVYPVADGQPQIIVDDVSTIMTLDSISRKLFTLSNGLKIIEGIGCINSKGRFLHYLFNDGILFNSDEVILDTYEKTKTGEVIYQRPRATCKRIEQVRKLNDKTPVILTVSSDTIYSTTDGRVCLKDNMFILLRGIDNAKSGMAVNGTLVGTKSSDGNYPLLVVDAAKSNYQLEGWESSFYKVDIDAYEEQIAHQEPPIIVSGDTIPKDNIEGVKSVKSIRAFRQLEPGEQARLELQRDTVLYVSGDCAYVRGDAPICFHATGLDLKVGMIMRGTLIGIRGEHDGIPTLQASEYTTDKYYVYDESPFMVGFYEKHYFSFDNLEFEDHSGDVMTVEDVVIDSLQDESGTRRLYACKGDKRLPVIDRFGVNNQPISVPSRCASIEAVLSYNNRKPQLFPMVNLKAIAKPLGITTIQQHTVSSSLYDLQGRRLAGKPSKGVYVQGNRKRVVK